jgi:hypothetical protein
MDLDAPLDEGNFKFNAFGTIIDDVNIKKINNRKIISVKEDILNSALTLLFFLSPISYPFNG